MKSAAVLWLTFFLAQFAFTQRQSVTPIITAKWAPTGLLVGSISLQGEYNFGGKNSLTAKIGIPANTHHSLQYQGHETEFDMKAFSFLAGYRIYLAKQRLKGLYLEPFFNYLHHTSEGAGTGTLTNQPVTFNFTNDYNGAAVGAQLGAQFLIGKGYVIDLFFLGPALNTTRNNFKAVEITNTLAWSNVQASEAEQDVRDILKDIPVFGNHINKKSTIMVDKNNHTVNAGFKGALPGIRAGVSFGVAF
ncbi:MAG: hypothetical protein ICV66_03270 [Chitinophagaceae bacterium]|nr:hypothetical protein [Chitinophagaceae bacterium]